MKFPRITRDFWIDAAILAVFFTIAAFVISHAPV